MALTVAETAKNFRISRATLTKWVNEGKIPYLKIHHRILFSRAVVEEMLTKGTIGDNPPDDKSP